MKKITRFLDFSDQTFLGLGLGKLFPARESLVSDILAGDGKSLNLYLQCTDLQRERDTLYCISLHFIHSWGKKEGL